MEAAGQEIRMQRHAVLGNKYVPGVLPDPAGRVLLGALPAAVLAQQPPGVPVEGDQTAAGGGFGWSDGDEVAVGDALLFDHCDPGVEVDVGPAQPGGFTAA
jgi:hypothetical protein